MGVRAYEAVWEHADAKGGTLLVLLALADHADRETGVAWPSTRTVAEMTRLEQRQVGRILSTLDESGHIDRWHYRDGSRWKTVYRVTLGPYAHLAGSPPLEDCLPGPPPTRLSPSRQIVGSPEATSTTGGGDISGAFEATSGENSPSCSEPSLEPSSKPYETVRDAWLACPALIRHRASYFEDAGLRRLVGKVVAKYGAEDTALAIRNFAEVLSSREHYWTKSWTFSEFLSRGVDRFVPEADPLRNFRSGSGVAAPADDFAHMPDFDD